MEDEDIETMEDKVMAEQWSEFCAEQNEYEAENSYYLYGY